jgi:hypothetical protein
MNQEPTSHKQAGSFITGTYDPQGEEEMSPIVEPNPPSRKEEDFPKTTTIPDGWDTYAIMERYNTARPVPTTGKTETGDPQPPAQSEAGEYCQTFDPFPKPNTIPSGWDLSEM